MAEKKINILYVDDEINNLISFRAIFRKKYQVYTTLDTDEAMQILEQNPVEIVIADQRMPKLNGSEFLQKVVEKFPATVRMLLTGFSDMDAVIEAVNKGKIFHYLTKPWNEDEMDRMLKRAYAIYEEGQNVKEMNDKLALSNGQLEFLLRQKLLS